MKKPLNNYAFIDGNNLHLAIRSLGWSIDYRKFRIYLREKYGIETAYIFVGFLEENQNLYQTLQKAGYILIFKEVLKYKDGSVKGNCDAELVLQVMIDFSEYNQAVIVSGDGDFACLVRHLQKHQKLNRVLIPNQKKYSALLKKAGRKHLDFMNDLCEKLKYRKYKKRTP